MESDDLAPRIPRKRSRSPSPSAASISTITESSLTAAPPSSFRATGIAHDDDGARPPAPKRLRRSHDVPDYHAPLDEHTRRAMAGANPLSRRVLKREAKKARRAANRAVHVKTAGVAGMEVDEDSGLEATFMT